MRSWVKGRSLGVSRRNIPMMAPIFGSTLMTKTLSSLPTNSAQALLAGRMPRIWTATTSFFISTVYCSNTKTQVQHKSGSVRIEETFESAEINQEKRGANTQNETSE